MAKFRSVALRLGYIGNVCYAFLFFPVTRLSSILPLVGLTSESSIKYHIWLGHLSMALAVLHSVGFVVYYAVSNQMIEVINFFRVSSVSSEFEFLIKLSHYIKQFTKVIYFSKKFYKISINVFHSNVLGYILFLKTNSIRLIYVTVSNILLLKCYFQ